MSQAKPDAVIALTADSGCKPTMLTAKQIGLEVPILYTGACVAPNIVESVGEAAEGSTFNLCDDWFVAQMQDTATGAVQSVGFTISEVVAANEAGNDYVASLTTYCDYHTDLHFGDEYTLLSQFAGSKDCAAPAGDTPADEPTVDSGDPVVPGDQAGADVPGTTTPDTTVPAPTGGSQTTGDGQLPHTGTSSTTLVAGGLLLLGLGLGALSIGIARRRQAA